MFQIRKTTEHARGAAMPCIWNTTANGSGLTTTFIGISATHAPKSWCWRCGRSWRPLQTSSPRPTNRKRHSSDECARFFGRTSKIRHRRRGRNPIRQIAFGGCLHFLCSPSMNAKGLLFKSTAPKHYIGTDPLGVPCWSHYPLHAVPIDGDKVQSLLNEVGRFEPSVRAVIYPACLMTLPGWANGKDQA